MIKAPIKLRDLRQRIYVKAKAEPGGNTGGHGWKRWSRKRLLWAALKALPTRTAT